LNRLADRHERARGSAERLIVILDHPRNVPNIGGVVRAMKNMGFSALRLVSPAPFAPADITGIAHRCEDILTTIQSYADLDSALADIHYVVGTTARLRSDHAIRYDLRTLAGELAQRVHASPPQMVGVLFGPEDNGLDNDALDRCQHLLSLPTDPTYPSLNLSHAVLLLLYELRIAMDFTALTAAHLAAEHPPTQAQRETLFTTLETALKTIEFFKSGDARQTMHTLRVLTHRAAPNERELALLTAISREVVKFFERVKR
jgi:TrmH family RNA methyltransferase